MKIAEERKDGSFKRAVKNVALASLGAAAGTGTAMLGHELLKRTIGPKYEKLLPATKMKIVGPLLGLSTMALIGTTLALQREMSRPEEKKGSHV